MNDRRDEPHWAALEEIFNEIRVQHATPDQVGAEGASEGKEWLVRSLKTLANKLKSEHEFVLGAFVRWQAKEDGYRPILVELNNGQRLFFRDDEDTGFMVDAHKTLNILEGGKDNEPIFLSSIVHELIPHRARMVELAIRCTCKSCKLDNFALGEWGKVHFLGKLAESVRAENPQVDTEKLEQLRIREQKYAKAIPGYFKGKGGCHILVYCPFLVSDGKPPGNFFGVFRKCTKGSECGDQHITTDNSLVTLLSAIQMAGTLVFAQFSIVELLDIENHEKYKKISDLLQRARAIRTKALREMDELYEQADAHLNPYGPWAGVDALDNWISFYEEKCFGDAPPEGCKHNCSQWDSSGGKWFKDEFHNKSYASRLKSALGEDKYKNLFAWWGEKITCEHSNKLIGCCIAKMLKERQLPLLWVMSDLGNKMLLPVKLKNKVPPLVVFSAIQLLGAIVEVVGDDVIVKVSIADDGRDLEELKESATSYVEKVKKGDRSTSKENQTTASLAALICSSNGQSLDVIKNDVNHLTGTFTYILGKEPE